MTRRTTLTLTYSSLEGLQIGADTTMSVVRIDGPEVVIAVTAPADVVLRRTDKSGRVKESAKKSPSVKRSFV